jgi:hypothetical protein
MEMGKLYSSPFREDKVPSCSFFLTYKGKIIFRDFGRGISYSAIDFVKERLKTDFASAVKQVLKDRAEIEKLSPPAKAKERDFSINIVGDTLGKYLDYWKKYGISKETLVRYGVRAASSVYKDDTLFAKASGGSPIFVYTFPSARVRIYRPFSRTKKWYGNANENDIGGLVQLPPRGSILFITSSIKDVMVIRECGFSAICPSSENTNPEFLRPLRTELRRRFRYIVILYDNDEAGRGFSSKLKSTYSDFFEIFLVKSKDISDRSFKVGIAKTKKELKKLISKTYKSDIYDRETFVF